MHMNHFDRNPRPGRRTAWSGLATLAAAALFAAPAPAQDVTTYAVTAVDGDETNIELLGVSIRPEGYGLKPVLSLQGYRLGYEAGEAGVTVWSFQPAVGVGYQAPVGSIEGKVGYSFQEEENNVPFFDGVGGGVQSSLQAVYWGGEPELQALASYGWESNSLYTQAQGTYAFWNLNPGEVGIGAEAVWQGDLGDEDGYRAQLVGPVLRWTSGQGLIAALSSGWKNTNLTDDTWYLKLTFVYDAP